MFIVGFIRHDVTCQRFLPSAGAALHFFYGSLNAIVAHTKNCTFWINTMIALENMRTTKNNDKNKQQNKVSILKAV
jgi:hypothetical protein